MFFVFFSRLQSSEELTLQLAALETEKAGLVETVSQKDTELAGLGAELERVQRGLTSERESGVKAAEALQNQLNEKVKNWLCVELYNPVQKS